jgi:hypothetical protein
MGPEEAAFACDMLRVKQVLPVHWGTFPALTGKPEALRALVAASSMWSLCPWVTSTASTSVGWCHAGGQEGFVFSHGSTSSRLPPGERKRQVPCPSQVMPRDEEAIEEVYSWLQVGAGSRPGHTESMRIEWIHSFNRCSRDSNPTRAPQRR